MKPASTRCARFLSAIVMVLLACPDAPATTYTSPSNSRPSTKNGLKLGLSYENPGGYGYLPVTATLTASKPANRDRFITVRLYSSSAYSRRTGFYNLAYEEEAELPAGATELTLDLKPPKLSDWNSLWWEVWVDGVQDYELRGAAPWQGGYPTDQAVRVLRPDGQPGAPFVSFEDLVDADPPAEAPDADAAQAQAPPQGYTVLYSYQSLPSTWQDYTCFDAVALSVDEFELLPPNVRQALLKWVYTGGMLILEEAGKDLSRLAEVDRRLDRERGLMAPGSGPRPVQPAPEGSQGVPDSAFEIPAHPHWRWAEVWMQRNGSRADRAARRRARASGRLPRSRPAWFAESQYGFGLVTAFPARLMELPPSPSSRRRARATGLAYYLYSQDWSNRHGSTPDDGCDEFSNWLIPGVGAAPVDAFRWLITLFVLLVGPVCYFWLRAVQRTHLLALTAPVAALGFTLCLYAYATFGDGLGTRVRVRSLTLLDQATGDATSWSRQTYYSGLAPAEGLVFSKSSLAYPLLPGWRETFLRRRNTEVREVVVEGNTQRLASGWLRSRESAQFLIIDQHRIGQFLEIHEQDNVLLATNHFASELERVLARDSQGQWWSGQAIGPGEEATMQAVQSPAAAAALRSIMLAAQPEYPPGMEEGWRYSSRGRRYQVTGSQLLDLDLDSIGYGPTLFSNSRLEKGLQLVSGSDTGQMAPLQKNCYVAISREAIAVPIGVSDASEEGSLHVTVGRWAP